MAHDQVITSIEQLEAIYGDPVTTSILKELDHITDDYRQFIDAAPFVVLATSGPEGLDCSPRGDPAGFVRIVDERTLMIPDRRGNNRVDSLRNIVRDPRVALLFLIPGVNDTMRVNGTAVLSLDDDLRQSFAMGDKVPACVIVITVGSIYTQCPKALVRSRLWDMETQIPRSALPTSGQIMQAITNGAIDGAARDAAYPEHMRQTIY
ncbi:MAG: pyridoxamine 5-phosphate oxidase [Ilumatobacteraceae bacterium]|nr:pyridoxamine 5-phosphate oxidase [Ilumatobacteraceae bacterium]